MCSSDLAKYFSFEEYKKAIEGTQTDKDKKLVYLYATDPESQYTFIEEAKNKGYDVLLLDCELDSHFVNLLEQKIKDSRFARVDSDSIDNLIPKEEKIKPQLSEEDNADLSEIFKAVLPKENEYYVMADNLGENASPILITQSEFMRRYREMSSMGGGMNFYGEMPASYNITVNMQNPLVAKIMDLKKTEVQPAIKVADAEAAPSDATEEQKKLAEEAKTKADAAKKSAEDAHKDDLDKFADANEILHQITDLALLANGMLKGKALSDFIARSEKVVSEAYGK